MDEKTRKKIVKIVKDNYCVGAFREKENANYFASLWKQNWRSITLCRSWGPSVEGMWEGKNDYVRCYFVIASK